MSEERKKLWPYAAAAMALPMALALAYAVFPDLAGRLIIAAMARPYKTPRAPAQGDLSGTMEGPDAQRSQLSIALHPVARGLQQPTDIQFPPGRRDVALVLEKGGTLRWLALASGDHGALLQLPVVGVSEQGLLGLAFHPDFADNGRFFLNYVAETDAGDATHIQAYTLKGTLDDPAAALVEAGAVLLRVVQPFQNHNGGQLAFGPDGFLYVGLGDGGLRDDPKDNGQDRGTLLGSMLRIDVDGGDAQRPYGIPADNPYVGVEGVRPEIWAHGLRNPWRYSFDPAGRLVVADVGQDRFEEISFVGAGSNMGWALKEGFECFPDGRDCSGDDGLSDPFLSYGRSEGMSITGGYVYTGQAIPGLVGLYVYGDFVTGRLWAARLPKAGQGNARPDPTALGDWPILPSSFGRDSSGELYVVGFGNGVIYKLTAASATDGGLGPDDASAE